jgi:hypothetical protein
MSGERPHQSQRRKTTHSFCIRQVASYSTWNEPESSKVQVYFVMAPGLAPAGDRDLEAGLPVDGLTRYDVSERIL